MGGELWDLTDTVERMAVAMWAHEAWRAERWTTAENRTLEAFRNEAPELRQKWIGLAGAGLESVFAMKPKEAE